MFIRKYLDDIKWFLTEYRTALLSFFLPALILEVAYIVHGVFPFGRNDVLIIDLYHQYAPFLLELREKILSMSSLFYTWTGGLGTSFLPLFAYYIASPLNILIVLFPENYLSEAVLFLILVKVGLAGVCFAWYLKETHREDNLGVVAFSLLYALSGYVLAYSWNIMWLDGIYLLPVVILGLVRLVREGRGILFCVSLALVIFTNFYIAFFVCLFVLLYYPVCLFQYHSIRNPGLLLRKTAWFAGYSLLAAGLTAVLIVPAWSCLRLTSASGESFPRTLTHYFDLFDYISRHFTLASPSIRDGMANIYSGIVVLILLPVYFMSRQIRHKVKLWHAALMLVLIASFNTNYLNFVWHGLHFPNQLPFRNSFVYVFLVLSMAYTAYKGLKEFKGRHIWAISGVIMLTVLLSQKLDVNRVDIPTAYLCFAIIVGYTAVLTLEAGSARMKRALAAGMIFLVMVTAETTVNTIMVVNKIDMAESYSSRYGYSSGKEVREIREQVDSIGQNETGFYRMEVIPPRTTNDPFLYGYRGLSIFASTYPEKPVKLLERLGYHSNGINSFKYEGSTLVLDSLFSIKYLIRRNNEVEHVLREKTDETEELAVYQNPAVTSPGIVAPKELKEWNGYGGNPFEVQNGLMETLTGVGDILVKLQQERGFTQNLEFTNSGTRYYYYSRKDKERESTAGVKITIEEDRETYLYLDVRTGSVKNGHVMVGEVKVNFNATRSTMVDLGFVRAGTPVELNLVFKDDGPETGRFEVHAYSLEEEAFRKAFSALNDRQMQVESFNDTGLTGHVSVPEDSVMFMTVPFDRGWSVWVDGQEVGTYPLNDCFLCFDMEAGDHIIEMRFIPQRLYAGICITLLSLFVFLSLFIWNMKFRHSYGGSTQQI